MKAKLLGLIACVALFGVSQASAATLVGTTTNASGIDGLVVDGVTYDVTFVNASYDTVYASTPPTFFGNTTGASDAANTLRDVLNASHVEGLTELSSLTIDILLVPTDATVDGTAVVCNFIGSCGWGTSALQSLNPTATTNILDLTVFTPVATPLPTALPLFATGLGALGLFGWRRKRKPAALAA